MKKQVLLTGDDGFQSAGTRLLIHFFKDKYELTVAGTTTQQSGVGGTLSIYDGFNWKKTQVDGVPAYQVDGSPADCAELLVSYDDRKFDFVISGINWGANMGPSLFGSGTVNAALRSLGTGIASKAITLSWDVAPEYYTMDHSIKTDLGGLIDYPGKIAAQVVELAVKNNFWGADLLNVNLPLKPTRTMVFTRPTTKISDVFDYTGYWRDRDQGQVKQHYSYAQGGRVYNLDLSSEYDVKAVSDGYISIAPCKFDILNETIYNQVKGKKIQL